MAPPLLHAILCICSSPSLLDEPLVQADAALLASVKRHLDTIMTVDKMSILDADRIMLLKIVKNLFNDSKTAFRPYFKKVLRAPLTYLSIYFTLAEATHFLLMLLHTLQPLF